MKVIFLGLFISTELLGGYLVPNIQRRQLDLNETGSSIGWSKRNNLNSLYSFDKTKFESDVETKVTNTGVTGFFSGNSLSGEFLVSRLHSKYERPGLSADTTNYSLRGAMGFKVNPHFTLGGSLTVVDSEVGPDVNVIGFSGSYKLPGNILIGGGLARLNINSVELKSDTMFFGVGYLIENISAELVLLHTPSEEEKGNSIGEATEIQAIVTYHPTDKFEIHSVLSLNNSSDDAGSIKEKGKEYDAEVEVEYLIHSNFAVGAGVSINLDNEEEDDGASVDKTDYLDQNYGLSARFIKDQFQVAGKIDFGEGETEGPGFSSDRDHFSLDFAVSFFF